MLFSEVDCCSKSTQQSGSQNDGTVDSFWEKNCKKCLNKNLLSVIQSCCNFYQSIFENNAEALHVCLMLPAFQYSFIACDKIFKKKFKIVSLKSRDFNFVNLSFLYIFSKMQETARRPPCVPWKSLQTRRLRLGRARRDKMVCFDLHNPSCTGCRVPPLTRLHPTGLKFHFLSPFWPWRVSQCLDRARKTRCGPSVTVTWPIRDGEQI